MVLIPEKVVFVLLCHRNQNTYEKRQSSLYFLTLGYLLHAFRMVTADRSVLLFGARSSTTEEDDPKAQGRSGSTCPRSKILVDEIVEDSGARSVEQE